MICGKAEIVGEIKIFMEKFEAGVKILETRKDG